MKALGYAYGMHDVEGNKSVIIRAFQGYVVAPLSTFKPIGVSGAPFPVYELSFQAPRGLSGAPLFGPEPTATIYGVVIGNSESRMTVFRSEERSSDGTQSSSVEQYEALSLGVAVQATAILNQRSEMLGSTLRDYVEKNNRLV